MYSVKTVGNVYAVVDENDNKIAEYAYRSQARDHVEALNSGKDFVPRSLEIYEDLR
jgi:hypothetical protein